MIGDKIIYFKCLKLLDQRTYPKDAEDACTMNQREGSSYLPLPANQKENDDYPKAFEEN